MKDQIKSTLPNSMLTHGNIFLGNNSINGLQIFQDAVVVPFYFGGNRKARSTAKLEDILKLCDGFANLGDCNIPYSYVRMEIDPVDTTVDTNGNLEITSIGLEEDGYEEYFAGGLNCCLNGIADFLYIDTGVGCGPIDKLKKKRDKFMTMNLNGNPINATVYLEITVFFFYIPSIHGQKINNAKVKGEVRGNKFYALDYIKSNGYYKKVRDDKEIEEDKGSIRRQEIPFRINDRVQFVYYDENSIRRFYNVRITGFSTNIYEDDIIELNQNLPNLKGNLFGIQNPCLEENCKWHSGDMNPMKHKFDEQCIDCVNSDGSCNSRSNYPNYNGNRYTNARSYNTWRF